MQHLDRRLLALASTALALAASGCGAAYYGGVALGLATQEDTKTIDTSFPDAAPTAPVAPGFATLRLSGTQVRVSRQQGPQTVTVEDYEVLTVDFPAGFGEARSNRDVGKTLQAGDRLVLRLNGDTSQELTFAAGDVASVGTAVAAAIQAKVRALAPVDADVAAEAYSLFSASYDGSVRGYRFVSGAPGDGSAVVWMPQERPGTADAVIDPVAEATAARLGLGVDQGGIELTGAESVRFTVLNRGTDTIPAGTTVDLYLSHDKVLDPSDVLFDRVSLDAAVEVGQARAFTRRNGDDRRPPATLIRQDFTPGKVYVLFEVSASGGEQRLQDNVAVSLQPLEVYQPVDDPATDETVEVANALDLAIVRTANPISVVAGGTLGSTVTVTNLGAAVPAGGVPLDLDLVLSSDRVLDEPAALVHPTGAVAGLRIDPTDPNRAIQVVLNDQGAAGLATTVSGNTITVSYQPASTAPVQSLIDALSATGLVLAAHDGQGAPASDPASALLAAQTATEVVAKDIRVASRRVTFAAAAQPGQSQTFSLQGVLATDQIKAALLPRKLFPLFRLRPQLPAGLGPEAQNTNNDVREGANYVRVYDRARAFFDATTGTYLPTLQDAEFARLEAVTQRPVNAGSIGQGQQRVFSFQIPTTNLIVDESQLLILLQARGFDAHVDLLSASGEFITGSDDSGLGLAPLLYTSVFANPGQRTFYLVVAPARFDESDLSGAGETFELTLSVKARQQDDPALAKAVRVQNLLTGLEQRYDPQAPRLVNDVLIPFSLSSSKAEVMFVLPARARVRFRSGPVFGVGVEGEITVFVPGQIPSPLEFQPELAASATTIVYRPTGGTVESSHLLEAGVYTVAFDGVAGQTDDQPLRLEVDSLFVPPPEQ